MRIIAIMNQKGGVGKTTTVLNLGVALSKLGKRVLMIDLDHQAHLTISSGIVLENLRFSIYDALIGKIPIKRIIEGVSLGLSLIPSHPILSKIEIKRLKGSEFLLKESFKGFGRLCNYILIDCPPSLGRLTMNALCFAREIFIVTQTEYLALKSLPPLLEAVDKVGMSLNPEIKVTGVVACLYDQRRKIDRRIKEEIRNYFKEKMFETAIRKNVSLAESPTLGKDIFRYAPLSYGAQDYLSLAREVIKMEKA
ncbi:MAG: ParA family protein [Candidatus Aminicenantes bacterium]|nr:ParA family protein [Candidatus Aminicenantes bacterium]